MASRNVTQQRRYNVSQVQNKMRRRPTTYVESAECAQLLCALYGGRRGKYASENPPVEVYTLKRTVTFYMIPNCELQVIKDSLESSRKEINITSEHFTTTQHWQSEHFKSVEFISLRHKHKLECPQNHNKLLPRKMKFRQLFGLTSRSTAQTNMDETRTEDRAGKTWFFIYI